MYNINQLKQRINSISKTQKITSAMRLVAMSLYNRIERRRSELTPFLSEIKATFKLFMQHRPIQEQIRATTNPINQSELIIIVSSSKGLCGGFHEQLRKFFKLRFKKDALPQKIIKIGQKTTLIGGTATQSIDTLTCYESLTAQTINSVAEEIMCHIYAQNYKTVRLFSNRFTSFFSYRQSEIILYPLSGLSESDAREQSLRHIMTHTKRASTNPPPPPISESFSLEQPFDEMQLQIIKQYGIALLAGLLAESLTAEQTARFLSMDTATKNAGSVLDKLKLQCNKLRQALITREVAELSRTL